MNISRLLSFEKLHTIRDLGGMTTSGGGKIAGGRLICCGHLSDLSESDKTAFTELADTVIDFRTDAEQREKPDIELEGIEYHNISVIDSLTAGITREEASDKELIAGFGKEPEKARQYMCGMYRTFAANDHAASQYAKFIRILMQPRKKAIVWHCTAGKDRAGVATAIVEELLGVEREEVIEDYLMTNEYLKKDIAFLTEFAREQFGLEKGVADEALQYLFGAKRDYIEEFYRAIESKYGSFPGFIREGLELSEEDVEKLQEMYLVS